MIKILGDYHTHTIFSSGFRKKGTHATGTIEDNANAALKKGLTTLAISEHGPGHYLYGVRKENIPLMKEEIKRLNEYYVPRGLTILLGVEANLVGLDGELDVDDEFIRCFANGLSLWSYAQICKRRFGSLSIQSNIKGL